jgi:hypothetical protein
MMRAWNCAVLSEKVDTDGGIMIALLSLTDTDVWYICGTKYRVLQQGVASQSVDSW